jgi:hypothetical protein
MMEDWNTKPSSLLDFWSCSEVSQTDKHRPKRMLNTIDNRDRFRGDHDCSQPAYSRLSYRWSPPRSRCGEQKDSTGEMSLAARQHGTIEQRRDPIGDLHHLGVAEELKNRLIPALEKLHAAREAKAKEFRDITRLAGPI